MKPELPKSSEEKGAVNGEDASRRDENEYSKEADEEEEAVPTLELGLFR